MKPGGPLKRRTPLASSDKPLASGKPLKRTAPLKARPENALGRKPPAPRSPSRPPVARQRPREPRTPIRAASPRRAGEKRTRAALVARLARDGVRCEVCPELARHGITVPGGCSGLGGLHERRKRSSAGSVEHVLNLIPACNNVNAGWIENEPAAARAFGTWLVLRQGDPDWDACAQGVEPVPLVVSLCRRCGEVYVTVPPSGELGCGHRP